MPLRRHPDNPILTPAHAPFPCSLLFNAGVCRPVSGPYAGRYVMVFRNDYGPKDAEDFRRRLAEGKPWDGTNLGLAVSDDGVAFRVEDQPVWSWSGELDGRSNEVRRVYDPRLTVLDGQTYMCFAMDTTHGVRGGVARTEDFRDFEVLHLAAPDNRNMVLFPERFGGRMARFERPMPIYGRGGPEQFDLWYADSPDGRDWGNQRLVLGSEEVPYCNCKIGPGAPPIRTDRGWLAAFHYVHKDEDRPLHGWEPYGWTKTYGAGLILTDLDEPWRVIGLSPEPVLAPETDYENKGFRGGVIFPGGMLRDDDGTVRVYYGGADTVECLATAHVDELLALVEPWSPS
ncbi:MAG: glycoside hydrolase family 130 protein [Planctomycetota bacterium]